MLIHTNHSARTAVVPKNPVKFIVQVKQELCMKTNFVMNSENRMPLGSVPKENKKKILSMFGANMLGSPCNGERYEFSIIVY